MTKSRTANTLQSQDAPPRGPGPYRIALATFILVVLWAALLAIGTYRGWGLKPFAEPNDADSFMKAADQLIATKQRGDVAMVLVRGGEIVARRGASIGRPVNENTRFQAASVSKTFTALGVMTLVEQGKVGLDDPVEMHLKRWKLPPSPYNSDVTIRRLLSHTAGLTDGLGYGGFAPGEKVQTLLESLDQAKDAAPGQSGKVQVGAKPTNAWRYSGGGYSLLQLMIEDVTGETFAGYMQRAVLDPLGMTRSTFEFPEGPAADLAPIFDAEGHEIPYRRYAATGAAALFTTANDLARLVQIQCPSGSQPAGGNVLRPSTLRTMLEPTGHGYGSYIWGLGYTLFSPNNQGAYIAGHDGENYPTINTTVRFDPANCDGIAVLATGEPFMADELGAEWVRWHTGHVETRALIMGAMRTLIIFAIGAFVLVLAGFLFARRARRARRGRSV